MNKIWFIFLVSEVRVVLQEIEVYIVFFQNYELYWKRLRSTTDDDQFTLLDVVPKDRLFYTVTTVEGTEYSFRIRIIADNGYPGIYAEEPFVATGGWYFYFFSI